MWIAPLLSLAVFGSSADGYASPELNRRAIAGVWRLKGKSSLPKTVSYPMKEFTIYPKKTSPPPKEYLLILKEDGSFQQCDEETKNKKAANLIANMRGTWDFLDGKLILAADRDSDDARLVHDTLLVGQVVAKSSESLTDTQVVEAEEQAKATAAPTPTDVHLSVPRGAVQVGKFMYPKKHKMFFEQPMFNPMSLGSFELKQVLGALNAGIEKDKASLIERFRKADFADKMFLLTNYPIPERTPKGDLRWSIKRNKFVRDPVKKSKKDKETEKNKSTQISVMEVKLFANNTFSTTAGLGGSTVLRGKWWIVGDERDRLWMQVWRFGFGRSVSGSTFSEGRMLSHDDAKTYWGSINYVDEDETNEFDWSENGKSVSKPSNEKGEARRLQVKGSVIVGWGLEPQPVARFIMREEIQEAEFDDEEEEDDDEVSLRYKMPEDTSPDEDIDWSNAFQ